ncbi:unnamed protein product [Victoria cruziana]
MSSAPGSDKLEILYSGGDCLLEAF